MDKLTNQVARQYLRQVRGLLPCSRAVKDEITAPLVRSLNAFLEEQPQADAEALRARFGVPEAIAATCLESTDTAVVLKKLRTKRRFLAIVAAAAAAVLIFWAGFLGFCYLQLKNEVLDGYTVTEAPLIEEVIENIDVSDSLIP